MATIHIGNRQKNQKIDLTKTERIASRILDALECPEAELSVVVVDDAGIQELNRDYLGRDRPTNVISFPMLEGEESGIVPGLLGDVVISADTAARDAEEAGSTFEREFFFLLIHGILHLVGFNHEGVDDAEIARMEAKEDELFALVAGEL
ncbi:MAG: rRNA maturation RNase YbeY [Deltaproteobacteria bacterium]|nr:rRNA maturation RNase YbeY [Deltaproteobacteria bacterium]MBR5704910.1 rRNA maturation RNase YbeY [Deltaproteobacteria bacterium]